MAFFLDLRGNINVDNAKKSRELEFWVAQDRARFRYKHDSASVGHCHKRFDRAISWSNRKGKLRPHNSYRCFAYHGSRFVFAAGNYLCGGAGQDFFQCPRLAIGSCINSAGVTRSLDSESSTVDGVLTYIPA
jgi:hypothetical protein